MSAQKPILIAGGGLASLLLARYLQRATIPYLVFERDASISFRAQGYRLRLSPEGLDAIRNSLGPESFAKFYDRCGKTGGAGFAAIDPLTGEVLESQSGNTSRENLTSAAGKVVGIARGDMRALFMEGCENSIRWSHTVSGYELTPDGVRAIFSDGSKSVEGSMLVGGEGNRSVIAKQLTNGKIKVYDSGARGIHGQASTTAFKGLGEGVFRFTDDKSFPGGKIFMITNVRPDDMNNPDIKFGWTLLGSPGVINPSNDDFAMIGKPAANIAKTLTAKWHPRVKPVFDEMDTDEAAFWKITCSSPEGVPEWPNEPRVTILGDAAHAMTPAGGNGANTAMRDSELLGRLLAQAGGYKVGITEQYEKEMRVYASEAVKKSAHQAISEWGSVFDPNTTPTIN